VTDHQLTDYRVTPPGKDLDVSFIGKPHEYEPRRTYSTTATDWQARVDFDRLRRDRLARARMMMEQHDLGALVCFVGENLRYITSVFQGNWKNNIFIRYCVLPRGGDRIGVGLEEGDRGRQGETRDDARVVEAGSRGARPHRRGVGCPRCGDRCRGRGTGCCLSARWW